MTADISRNSFRPEQRYIGLVHQQGRLPLDADENEGADMAEALTGLMVSEAICKRGSPDGGFTVSNVAVAGGKIDFDIAAGSFYLGGVRFGSDGARFSDQPDWLTEADSDLAWTPPAAGKTRTDLVWLEGWEQVVTATEDSELYERALGGPDTTARKRAMWQVRLLQDTSGTCDAAFDDLVARQFPGGTLDPGGAEILSDARLTVGFTNLSPTNDLCRPSAQAGFLGARNEAFRVQVTTPGRFVWGRDNAAPLYRVQITTDDNGKRRRLHFLTLPRDEFGWPLAKMTVELLRWGSLLANHEKAAEAQGLLLNVVSGFSPDKGNSIDVDTDLDAALDIWFTSPAGLAAQQPLDKPGTNDYFYLRVWTGGGSGGKPDNPMQVGTAVTMGDTGLTLTFANSGLAGDYWVIAARPNTPSLVTPWSLLTGAPAAGPRRFAAPLALIRSTYAGVDTVGDCRHSFRPLCEVGACCRITVGDGAVSIGDVDSIQKAIDKLPPEGGEICIHPGRYAETVRIKGRRNILITGCGRETVWTAPDEATHALVRLVDSRDIHIRRLHMRAPTVEAIHGRLGGGMLRNILFEDIVFHAADRAAILLDGGRRGGTFTVRRCRILLEALSAPLGQGDDVIGTEQAIFLRGIDLTIEQSRILASDEVRKRTLLPAGGIQIGGGSRRVLIRDNRIWGGNSNGITLGSVRWVNDNPAFEIGDEQRRILRRKGFLADGKIVRAIGGFFNQDDNGCIVLIPPGGNVPPGGGTPESDGPVIDVHIFDNEIRRMGYSGISTPVFTGLGKEDQPDAIAVEGIEIGHNRIVGNVLNEIPRLTLKERLLSGWGGIALSICADGLMRDNLITGNGADVAQPVCGIFIAVGEDIRIERNEISGNGAVPEGGVSLFDARDGIHIGLLLPRTGSSKAMSRFHRVPDGNQPPSELGSLAGPEEAIGLPAIDTTQHGLFVSDNIVAAPAGRALEAILFAPALVHGNRLSGGTRARSAAGLRDMLASSAKLGGQRAQDLSDLAGLEAVLGLLGGDVVSLFSLTLAQELWDIIALAGAQTSSARRQPRGSILVNDNQILLHSGTREGQGSVSSVLLVGGDDIAFQDNQTSIDPSVVGFLTNAMVFGTTARIDGNRMQESLFAVAFLSLISFGFFNNSSHNQATHCIVALGPTAGRVVIANRVLLQNFLPEGICERFSKQSREMSDEAGLAAGFPAAVHE